MEDIINQIFQKLTFGQWLEIAIILAFGTIMAISLNYFVYPRLRKRAARNQSALLRILFKALRGETIIWIVALMIASILGIINQAGIISDTVLSDVLDFIGIFVLFTILWFIKDIVEEIVDYYARKGRIPRSSLFVNIIKYSIVIIFIIIILDQFGFSLTGLITALGIGGLAVALALQDTLSNFFAGLTIITAGQLKNGDYIELESGEQGYIRDITWRNTTIETLDQEMVVIPNYKLSNSTFINTSRPHEELLLRVHIGVDYSSDLEFVEQVTLQVARDVVKNIKGGIPEFEPKLFYNEFADSSINFSVVMKVQNFDYRRILRHHFIKEISKAYEQNDINIPFPIRTVKMDRVE